MNRFYVYKDKNVSWWWLLKDTNIMEKLYWQNTTINYIYGIR